MLSICYRCVIFSFLSHRNLTTDVWPWVVVFQFELLVFEVENAFDLRVYFKVRQWPWLPCQLQFHLFNMVLVNVCIAKCVDKVSSLESCDLCYHHQQHGIRSDVERDTQKNVGTALVQLQAQASVHHIKLEQNVARRQVHIAEVCYSPCADQQSA